MISMLYHPYDDYLTGNRSGDAATGSRDIYNRENSLLLMYAPQAIAAGFVFTTISHTFTWKNMKSLWNRWTGNRDEVVQLRDHVEATLGVQLPIDWNEVPAMMEEVHRFKWLEAEAAGRDIWRERSPENPEAAAIREWFGRHFGAWYMARKGQQAPA